MALLCATMPQPLRLSAVAFLALLGVALLISGVLPDHRVVTLVGPWFRVMSIVGGVALFVIPWVHHVVGRSLVSTVVAFVILARVWAFLSTARSLTSSNTVAGLVWLASLFGLMALLTADQDRTLQQKLTDNGS